MSYTEEELRDTTRKFIDMLSGKNMCEKNCERSFPRDQHLIVDQFISWREEQLPGTPDERFFEVNYKTPQGGLNPFCLDILRQLFQIQKRMDYLEVQNAD